MDGEDLQSWVRDHSWFCAVDSINHLMPEHAGRVVLSGSHGGLYSAAKGFAAAPRGLIVNDAGGGLNGAGIASLTKGDATGVAVCAVSHDSARIGDAADMLRRGVISHVNALARRAGVRPGASCAAAARLLAELPPTGAPMPEIEEYRHEVRLGRNGVRIACIDSASLMQPEDARRIVVTGSHGGLIGGDPDKAIKVRCVFAAFNDAGIGREGAGLGRLAPLDRLGIGAVTVGHMSAQIGNAISTLDDGVISHANETALHWGARPGLKLRQFLQDHVDGKALEPRRTS